MLRIGEAAKRFDISRRTLRYWEETGVLTSARMANGYRVYDEENALRIERIVLLRKLRMPISEIERILILDDAEAAIDALVMHLENLRNEANQLRLLGEVIDELIRRIRSRDTLADALRALHSRTAGLSMEHGITPQNTLSERKIEMASEKLSNVRIVNLPRMTVAAYCATSETPEDDCSKVMNPFIIENELHKRSGFRHFGFNNPSPTEGNPVYGYEIWVTIPEDFTVPAPFTKKVVDGGLYASISTRMSEIGERWRQLYEWSVASEEYEADFSFQWLEECTDFEHFMTPNAPGKQLDLLEPVHRI